MRFFNTTGPMVAVDHYCIPPLDRLDLPEVLGLVRDKRYFVLPAPRQTGKTSALLALRDRLAGDGYRCVYANVEVGQAGREDTARAMQAILGAIASRARSAGDRFLDEVWSDLLARYGPDGALREALTRWSAAGPRPLVLLLDEIDALVGDSLLSVLRQLREGYDRPRVGGSDAAAGAAGRGVQQTVIECKAAHGSLERTIAEGAEQTAGYVDRCTAQEGHLVVFDRSERKSWEEKIFRREASSPDGRTITVWGM